jgi:hypothetical protein
MDLLLGALAFQFFQRWDALEATERVIPSASIVCLKAVFSVVAMNASTISTNKLSHSEYRP